MANDFSSLDFDEWNESEEDEVLFESQEFSERFELEQEPSEEIFSDDLPVLPLRGVVVYPMMWLPLPVGQERSLRLVEDNLPGNRIIALVTSRDEDEDSTPLLLCGYRLTSDLFNELLINHDQSPESLPGQRSDLPDHHRPNVQHDKLHMHP